MPDHNKQPLISIVVPSFNHAQYLPRCLDSIFGQDYDHIEIVVADGGSEDGTVDILKDYAARYSQFKWLSEPDEGPADAVNKGLARVTGDIIGIQSSDDVYYRGAFAAVAKAFASHPDHGFVYGDVEGIDTQDYVLYRRSFPEFSWQAMFAISMSIAQSSVFFRRALADQIGGWNPRYYGCDLDYWMRLLFRTQAMHLPQALSGWRRTPEQRTRPEQFERIRRDYWHMIEESDDIATAPARIQRMARASKHLLVMRLPPESRLTAWRHLLIGAWLHPGYWRYNTRRRIFVLFPGYRLLHRVYAWSRNRLGRDRQPRKANMAYTQTHYR